MSDLCSPGRLTYIGSIRWTSPALSRTCHTLTTKGLHMHALGQFLEEALRRRGWSQAKLAREAGLSRQVVNGIIGKERTRIDRMPQDKTIDGIARALEVDGEVIRALLAQSMGLPVAEPTVVYDASRVADSDLLRELAHRLESRAQASGSRSDRGPASSDDYAWAARAGLPDQLPDGADVGPGRDDGRPETS